MIFGDSSIFAIECEITERIEDWTYAHFRLWADGDSIGDYDDEMDLQGGVYHLEKFLKYSDSRSEPGTDDKTKEEVFQIVFDSVMLTFPKEASSFDVPIPDESLVQYPNMIPRFHLDQSGMSSFSDKWNVILIERRDEAARLIWRELTDDLKDMEIREAILSPGYFEDVTIKFIEWAKASF